LHPAFVRPYGVQDIASVLVAVPASFLADLDGVFLLGGSAKQLRVATSDLFHYGCYQERRIFLHAFPRELMRQRTARAPRPNIVQAYRRAGVSWTRRGSKYEIEFTDTTLRNFYLYDVLLHELGHHVDRRTRKHDKQGAERYAKWFAEVQARRVAGQLVEASRITTA
jgi:hypothetical protein